MNSRDDIVDEVRAVREAYAARFNYDLAEMYKDLKAKEHTRGHDTETRGGGAERAAAEDG
jgi:hypothetical protein